MFKATLFITAFATTLALSARQAVEPCPNGDQMTLTAWLGTNDNCKAASPLIPSFDITIGQCTPVKGATLPLFVLATHNGATYDAKVYMADPKCAGTPLAEVTDFTGDCKEANTDIGTVAVMEKKINGKSSCRPLGNRRRRAVCAANEIVVEGYLGAGCKTAITPEGGVCVPTDDTCEKVSAEGADLPLYARVSMVGTTGSATIYMDDKCTSSVASFNDFNSANTDKCVENTSGLAASVKILKQ